MNLTGGIAGF